LLQLIDGLIDADRSGDESPGSDELGLALTLRR
jgi:hypothetical protein